MYIGRLWTITSNPWATLPLLYSCGKALHPLFFLPADQASNALAKIISFQKLYHHQYIIYLTRNITIAWCVSIPIVLREGSILKKYNKRKFLGHRGSIPFF